jgi:molecular chaperone Hsp33
VEVSADDTVLPFEVAPLDLRGRVVRLGPAVDTILTSHDYPQPVAKLLGEAIVLGVLLGTALKFEGRFILQTKTDGPVRMLVVDFMTPDKVRACAGFDKQSVAAAIAAGATDAGALLGRGHLAMTIDQGGAKSARDQSDDSAHRPQVSSARPGQPPRLSAARTMRRTGRS